MLTFSLDTLNQKPIVEKKKNSQSMPPVMLYGMQNMVNVGKGNQVITWTNADFPSVESTSCLTRPAKDITY